MTTKTWEIQLIELYCTVCKAYDSRLCVTAQRFSNNFRPQFTDEECITIYLWGIAQRRFEVKAIYNHIKMHLHSWFPKLPSYQLFNKRINFLAETIQEFAEMLVESLPREEAVRDHLMDSMPIVVAKGIRSRQAAVASEFCNKGYCSSQQMYYYGAKLHVLGQKRWKRLPVPTVAALTPASVNDLTAAKEFLDSCHSIDVYADKAYLNSGWQKSLKEEYDIEIIAPRKLALGQKYLDSSDALYSSAVSRARQAIESFFAWIQDKTKIQSASKVRSSSGLISFVFARLAFVCLVFLGFFNC